ncbi:MAG: alpha/beta hydrolase-fold protein, partial [Clostridia bacterium]
MSDIEEYANNYGVAVIMPNGLRSFYCDMEYGLKYFTYISKELPKICEDIFNIPNKRENKFIAGLSMGGYGAFKCAFTYPEDYAGCGSFSGAVDTDFVKKYIFNSPQYSKEAFAILGDDIKPDNDLFYLSSLANNSKYDLKVYQSCGKQDFLYTSNIKFKNHLEKLNFNYKNESIYVLFPKEWLEIIISNILDNAIKYSAENKN